MKFGKIAVWALVILGTSLLVVLAASGRFRKNKPVSQEKVTQTPVIEVSATPGDVMSVASPSAGIDSGMKVTSTAFNEENEIPSKYTCDSSNVMPELSFENIPENAKSLSLIIDDPDAPEGIWTHFLGWNLDPSTKLIKEGEKFGGVSGINSFGKTGYSGPCPPKGTKHRYFFRLYALDIKLDLPSGSKPEKLEEAMKEHILEKSELSGSYSKK